ncbi:hypothetical protein [Flavobacterium terrigena]|uniref:Uncharacterized protein n=1 Tax=Flavobacterium terrigena TaxID=402734 RepID=A0A1H6TV74_9FLAO|nr:hypothetical protein [Flavobacterium terrigena]SEI83911.1 hypothetical protein SAMN05660918_1774 [Flavobacterium terrigena]
MRALTLVIMILAFLVGGTCAGILFKNIENRMGTDGDSEKTEEVYRLVDNAQKEIEKLKKQGIDVTKVEDPQIQESLELIESTPPKWKVDYAGKLGILAAVFALVMLVVAFMKKALVTKLSLVVVAVSVLLWISTPDIEAGTFSGANPKSIATIALVGLIVASACAFMSYKLHLKKLQATS